jgi:PleD family two-component response regulator
VIRHPDTDQKASKAVATGVLKAMAEIDLVVDDQKVSPTCSIGNATSNVELYLNRELHLNSANDALYWTKDKGRNRVKVGSVINTL